MRGSFATCCIVLGLGCSPASVAPDASTCSVVEPGCACRVPFPTVEYYDGPPSTRGVGICKPGKLDCVDGIVVANPPAVMPGVETCNGLDDDCDGIVDDVGTDAGTLLVYRGLDVQCFVGDGGTTSACAFGVMHCGKCEPLFPDGGFPEECNGVDDDCNGKIDDGLNHMPSCAIVNDAGVALLGVCGQGHQVCDAGAIGCMQTYPKTSEDAGAAQCDGLDNDCDGKIDPNGYLYCAALLNTPKAVCSMFPLEGCFCPSPCT
jgi:hypothetical protein